jgi:hypothetical protein
MIIKGNPYIHSVSGQNKELFYSISNGIHIVTTELTELRQNGGVGVPLATLYVSQILHSL